MKEKLFVEQAIKRVELEKFLQKQLEEAGFTKYDIIKTPLVTRIVVNVTRPGLAIGKSGQNIRTLTENIHSRFGIENPQLEIREIQTPNLDAAAVANKTRALIERGYSWRSVVYKTLKDIMSSGAQGVEIIVGGKLQGKGGRKKKQRIAAGYMKKVGYQTRFVDFAKTAAYPKQGAIGIKVRIVKPDTVFADKVDIMQFLEQKKNAQEGKQKAEGAASEPAKEATVAERAAVESVETKAEEAASVPETRVATAEEGKAPGNGKVAQHPKAAKEKKAREGKQPEKAHKEEAKNNQENKKEGKE